MKKHAHILIGLVSILVAFGGLSLVGKYILPDLLGTSSVSTAEAHRDPAFNLPDMSGDRTKLSQFLGAPSVIVFWSTWSADSSDQVKILDDYLSHEADQAALIHVVAIDSQEDPSIVASFMKRGGYRVPVLIDSFGETTAAYGVKSLPTIYFLTREGDVSSQYGGILSERGLVEKIDELLKQSSVR